jgi:hypothetical protein
MTVTLSRTAPAAIAADLLVVPVGGPPANEPILGRLPAALRAALIAEARRRQFTGARGQECWAHAAAGAAAPVVLLLGSGGLTAAPFWYELADAVVRQAARLHAKRVTVAAGAAGPDALRALAEGVALARYRFTRYRSAPPPVLPAMLTLLVPAAAAALRRAARRARAPSPPRPPHGARSRQHAGQGPRADGSSPASAALARRGLRVRVATAAPWRASAWARPSASAWAAPSRPASSSSPIARPGPVAGLRWSARGSRSTAAGSR